MIYTDLHEVMHGYGKAIHPGIIGWLQKTNVYTIGQTCVTF